MLTATVPDADADRLRKMGDFLKDKEPNVVAVLAAITGEKITFLAACGKEAVQKGVKAGEIVKQVSAIAGGSGGGKPDSAMGGGKDPLMVDNALAMVEDVYKRQGRHGSGPDRSGPPSGRHAGPLSHPLAG